VTERVVVRSSSVEAARALLRRNAARGRETDATTSKLAGARFVARDGHGSEDTATS